MGGKVRWGQRCLIEREEWDVTAEDMHLKTKTQKRSRWSMSRRCFFFSFLETHMQD